MKKAFIAILIIIISVFTLSGCSYNAEKYIFGTYYSIKIEGKAANYIGKLIDEQLVVLDNALSTNNVNSDVYKINEALANQPIQVSEITAKLFKISKEVHKKTDGAFNPATFPLTELWSFSPSTFIGASNSIPNNSQIQEVLSYCDFNLFSLDETTLTITKKDSKAKLDFGAIAKGYAVDVAFDIAKTQKKVVIDVGRTYKVNGEVELMVAHPRNEGFVAKATLSNSAVASSGDYERYYIVNGKRYHHVLGLDGYPAGTFESDPIIASTIIGESATICDALSTATMVLGYELSKTVVEEYGYSALLLTENGYYTIGEDLFEITDQTRTKLN